MHRSTLAFAAVLIASFTSGCGRYYYRHRVMYAAPVPVAVVAVREVPPLPPAPPPPPAQPRPIVVHAPPGSVIIVNPNGRPQVVHQQAPVVPAAPAEPPPPAPAAPVAPAESDEGWFEQ